MNLLTADETKNENHRFHQTTFTLQILNNTNTLKAQKIAAGVTVRNNSAMRFRTNEKKSKRSSEDNATREAFFEVLKTWTRSEEQYY